MSQPQTLQIAVFLLYFGGALALIRGGVVIATGSIGGGFGIANEKKWGYGLGLAVALLPFVFLLLSNHPALVVRYDPIGLMFDVALVALLVHPQSREYQRIWFK